MTKSLFLLFIVTGIILISIPSVMAQSDSKPTFGIDSKTGMRIVDGGLVINDQIIHVDKNLLNSIDMENFYPHQDQSFTAKVYAPAGLHVMEFFFGIPEDGNWFDAAASITFELGYTGELSKVSVSNLVEDHIIINVESLDDYIAPINYDILDRVYCKVGDAEKLCYEISIVFTFNETPTGKVFAMQAIDVNGNSANVYFKDTARNPQDLNSFVIYYCNDTPIDDLVFRNTSLPVWYSFSLCLYGMGVISELEVLEAVEFFKNHEIF